MLKDLINNVDRNFNVVRFVDGLCSFLHLINKYKYNIFSISLPSTD